MIKKIIILTASIIISIQYVNADTIILKNGRKIKSDITWEENGQIKYSSYGATISIVKEEVEKVIKSSDNNLKNGIKGQNKNHFKFDIWKSGMTVHEVIRKAERNDIPINTNCSNYKHFNERVRKYINTSNEFCYYGNILENNASIRMHFTPATRLLHTIKISWYNNSDPEFIYEVDAILHNKYGEPIKKNGQKYKYTKEWFVDGRTSIILSKGTLNDVHLKYSDTIIEMTGQDEATKDHVQKRKEAITKDRSKF